MKLHSEISGGRLTLYFALLLSVTHNNNIVVMPDDYSRPQSFQKDSLAGKWKLIEFFSDRGDGTGDWMKPEQADTIAFYTDGKFESFGESPLSARQYDRYRPQDGSLLFTSAKNNNTENCPYRLESPERLLLYPRCREKCMRRYELIKRLN